MTIEELRAKQAEITLMKFNLHKQVYMAILEQALKGNTTLNYNVVVYQSLFEASGEVENVSIRNGSLYVGPVLAVTYETEDLFNVLEALTTPVTKQTDELSSGD